MFGEGFTTVEIQRKMFVVFVRENRPMLPTVQNLSSVDEDPLSLQNCNKLGLWLKVLKMFKKLLRCNLWKHNKGQHLLSRETIEDNISSRCRSQVTNARLLPMAWRSFPDLTFLKDSFRSWRISQFDAIKGPDDAEMQMGGQCGPLNQQRDHASERWTFWKHTENFI